MGKYRKPIQVNVTPYNINHNVRGYQEFWILGWNISQILKTYYPPP